MSDGLMNSLLLFIIMSAIFVALFLLLRELVMWYWKINKRIELAEKNNRLLEKILNKLDNQILSSKEQIKNQKSDVKQKISNKLKKINEVEEVKVRQVNGKDSKNPEKNQSKLINKKIWNRLEKMHGTIRKIVNNNEVEVTNRYGKFVWKIEDCDLN